MKQLTTIKKAMDGILLDPKASRVERIEAARVAASCLGLLVPSGLDSEVPTKLQIQLQAARRVIAEKLGLRRERISRKNRKAYLRRKIKALEAQQPKQEHTGEIKQ
jgi:hypothetical protein